MFNFLKKKKEEYKTEKYNVYNLEVKFKNNTIPQTASIEMAVIPISYRKLLNWYNIRDSKNYCYRGSNGVLSFDRNNIEYIKVIRNDYTKKY